MRNRPMRWICGAVALAAAAACGRSPTGGGGESHHPPAPVITGASLIAGGPGVLSGTGLDRLPELTVDGQAVTVTERTAAEIRFRMPATPLCDVDGRPVAIAAGAVTYTGTLSVPGVARMGIGESRMVATAELGTLCIQIPAGTEEYVLSSVNPSLDGRSGAIDTMFTLRVRTGAGPQRAAATARATADAAAHWLEGTPQPAPRAAAAGRVTYAAAPVPFDPRYATAGVGDTVRWVDYAAPAAMRAGFCELPKDSVPTYPVIVAAVSSSGHVVIGIDARNPRLPEWMRADQRALLARVAEVADWHALAAVREVMNREHAPAAGGGGRWWHIFSSAAAGFTLDGAGRPQAACRWNSEVAATLGPDVPLTGEAQVPAVAAYLIHEYGHQADQVEQIRRFGELRATVPGWLAEAWAQSVQESAARLASGQPTGARFDRLGPDAPLPDFYASAWGVRPEPSPWRAAEPYPRGPYEQGTRFLLYLRERWGDARLGSSGPRFYQRVAELGRFDPASLASLLGSDPVTLLDRWALAEVTDDLVDSSAAAARGLPQLVTWVPRGQGGGRALSRTQDAAVVFAAGRGNYVAWYLPARYADAGRGASLTFEGVRPGSYVVRLTRLR
jgi:hypothetical protein